jgi:hypothetical protein
MLKFRIFLVDMNYSRCATQCNSDFMKNTISYSTALYTRAINYGVLEAIFNGNKRKWEEFIRQNRDLPRFKRSVQLYFWKPAFKLP